MTDPVSEINGAQVADALRSKASVVRIVCETPVVFCYDDFLSAEDCDHVVALATGRMKRAEVAGDKSGIISDGRTKFSCMDPHDETPQLRSIADRVAGLLGVPVTHAENFQVIHYGSGAQYKAHFDAFNADQERGQRNLARGGQRITTTLCYLNTVDEGGATEFPKLNMEIRAVKGRLIGFNNCEGADVTRSPSVAPCRHAGGTGENGLLTCGSVSTGRLPAGHTALADCDLIPEASQGVRITRLRISVMSSMANFTPSRPSPDSFTPP